MKRRDGESDRIVFRGMEMPCRVGALPGESDRPQPVRIELHLELDLRAAAASDRLADTVDYGAVADAVRAVVDAGPYALLETLGLGLLRAATRSDAVRAAWVSVEKSRPPLGEDVGVIGIQMRRTREELH